MNDAENTAIKTEFRDLLTLDLELLADLHDREPDELLIAELLRMEFPSCLCLKLEDENGKKALELMRNALSLLQSKAGKGELDELAADYASIYLNHGVQASPEESVWLDEDGLICQDSMFQVRSWMKRYALQVKNWRIRPDDHLVYQLLFIAHLLSVDDAPASLKDAADFMDEHLLRWLGDFSQRVVQRCATPYYAGVAALTAVYAETLRDLLSEILGQPRPDIKEIEARMQKEKTLGQESAPTCYVPGAGPAV
ncbi:MAG: molecular chaperone TorD family protein [gamma proteobacterium symbiont of Bathyaustriella thionipta]|nr:molecular chaperone TorD family protein [gamma proteobacterium symbiont of Bathyaustriella thionipta]